MPMAECTQLLPHWGHNRPQHMATATSFHQSSPAASRECLQPSFHKENQIEEQIRPSPDLGLRAKIVSVDHHVTPWWCWQVRRKHSISSISNMIKWYQMIDVLDCFGPLPSKNQQHQFLQATSLCLSPQGSIHFSMIFTKKFPQINAATASCAFTFLSWPQLSLDIAMENCHKLPIDIEWYRRLMMVYLSTTHGDFQAILNYQRVDGWCFLERPMHRWCLRWSFDKANAFTQ